MCNVMKALMLLTYQRQRILFSEVEEKYGKLLILMSC